MIPISDLRTPSSYTTFGPLLCPWKMKILSPRDMGDTAAKKAPGTVGSHGNQDMLIRRFRHNTLRSVLAFLFQNQHLEISPTSILQFLNAPFGSRNQHGTNISMTDPWDQQYICLHESLMFKVYIYIKILYHAWMVWVPVQHEPFTKKTTEVWDRSLWFS